MLLFWGVSRRSCWSRPTARCWSALRREQKRFDGGVRLLSLMETFAPQNDGVTCAAPVCLLSGEQAANMKTGVSTTGCMKWPEVSPHIVYHPASTTAAQLHTSYSWRSFSLAASSDYMSNSSNTAWKHLSLLLLTCCHRNNACWTMCHIMISSGH